MPGGHVVGAVLLLWVGLHVAPRGVAGNALLKPAHRGMVWARNAFNSGGYDYMGVNCGGIGKIQKFDGMCGLCGDAFDGSRHHETGGQYATGEITNVVRRGERTMPVSVLLNGKQGGYFEFALCNRLPETRECFDTNLVKITEGRAQGDEFGFWPNKPGIISLTLEIPDNFACDHCVLQWKYVTGNTWGRDEKGHGCRGCGPQETFVNCADVKIEGWGTVAPPTTHAPPTTQASPITFPPATPAPLAPPTAPPTQRVLQFSGPQPVPQTPQIRNTKAPRQTAASHSAPDRNEGSRRGGGAPATHNVPSQAPTNPHVAPQPAPTNMQVTPQPAPTNTQVAPQPAPANLQDVLPPTGSPLAPVVNAVMPPTPQSPPTAAILNNAPIAPVIASQTLPQPTVGLAKVLTDVRTYVKRASGPAMIPKPPALSDQQIDALSSRQNVLPHPDPLQKYVQVGSSKLVVGKDYVPLEPAQSHQPSPLGGSSPSVSQPQSGSPGWLPSNLPGPKTFDRNDFVSFANTFNTFAQQMGQSMNFPVAQKSPAAILTEYTPVTDGAITGGRDPGFQEFGNINAVNEPWGSRNKVTPVPNDPWGSRMTPAPMVTRKVYDRYGVLMEKATVSSNTPSGGSTLERSEFVEQYLQPTGLDTSANTGRLSSPHFDSKASNPVDIVQGRGQGRQFNGMAHTDSSQYGGFDNSWRGGPENGQAAQDAKVDTANSVPAKPKSHDSWRRAPVHDLYTTKAPIDKPLQLFPKDRTTFRPPIVIRERYTNFRIGGEGEGGASVNSEPVLNTRNYDVAPSPSTSSLQGNHYPPGGTMAPMYLPGSKVPQRGPTAPMYLPGNQVEQNGPTAPVHRTDTLTDLGSSNTAHSASQQVSSTGDSASPVAPAGQDASGIGKKIAELNNRLDALKFLLNLGQPPATTPASTTTTTTTTTASNVNNQFANWEQMLTGMQSNQVHPRPDASQSDNKLEQLKSLLGMTDAPTTTTTPAPPQLPPLAAQTNLYPGNTAWNLAQDAAYQQQPPVGQGQIPFGQQNVYVDSPHSPLQWSFQTTTPSYEALHAPYSHPNQFRLSDLSAPNHWPGSGTGSLGEGSHGTGSLATRNSPHHWSDNAADSIGPRSLGTRNSPNHWSDNAAGSIGPGSHGVGSHGTGSLIAGSLVSDLNMHYETTTVPPIIDHHTKEVIQDIKSKMLASIRKANSRGRNPPDTRAGEGVSWQNQRWQEMHARAPDAQPGHVNYNVPNHVQTSNGRLMLTGSNPSRSFTNDANSNIRVQSLSQNSVLDALRQMVYNVGGPPPSAGAPPMREMHMKNRIKMERIKPLIYGEPLEGAESNTVVTTPAPTTTTQRQRRFTKAQLDSMRKRVAMIQKMHQLAEERPTQIDPSNPRPSHLSPGNSRPTQLGNIENVGREPQEPNNNRPTHISRHANNNRPSMVSYLESKRNQEASMSAPKIGSGTPPADSFETSSAQNLTEAERQILHDPGLSMLQRVKKLLELRRLQEQATVNEVKQTKEVIRPPAHVNEVQQSREVIKSPVHVNEVHQSRQVISSPVHVNEVQQSREVIRSQVHVNEVHPSREVTAPRAYEPPASSPVLGIQPHETLITQDNIGTITSPNGEIKNVIAIPLNRDTLFKIIQAMKLKNAMVGQVSPEGVATGL